MSESTYGRIRKERCEWCSVGMRLVTDNGKRVHLATDKRAWHARVTEPCTAPSPEAVIEEQATQLAAEKAAREEGHRIRLEEADQHCELQAILSGKLKASEAARESAERKAEEFDDADEYLENVLKGDGFTWYGLMAKVMGVLLRMQDAERERDEARIAFALQETTLSNESFRESLRSELIMIGLEDGKKLSSANGRISELTAQLAAMSAEKEKV